MDYAVDHSGLQRTTTDYNGLQRTTTDYTMDYAVDYAVDYTFGTVNCVKVAQFVAMPTELSRNGNSGTCSGDISGIQIQRFKDSNFRHVSRSSKCTATTA